MTHSKLVRRAAVGGVCVAVGAAAGISGSAAAPGGSAGPSAPALKALYAATSAGPPTPLPPGIATKIGAAGGEVHSVEVVPNAAGDGFDTVTDDSGTVKALSGDALTITEGTTKAVYATPTLTIPAAASVVRNFQPAKLSDVQPGDHVDVSADSDGTTTVFAVDTANWPPKPVAIAGCAKAGLLAAAPPRPAGASGPTGALARKLAGRALARAIGGTIVSPAGASVAVPRLVCAYKTP
ncbi:MAG TPA: hypothetical protein VG165_10975 [Solirubrobacteraceae bacterium]|jgi:hypothetical protein|nr:hypothetical protein [Solirubrobacteraceae bacterium]